MNTLIKLLQDTLFSALFHLAPRVASVFLFILVGHLSGPTEAGILALAVSYLNVFMTIMRGLDDFVVRQVSREPNRAFRYLSSFSILRLGLSLLSYVLLVLILEYFFEYARDTSVIILILTLTLVPDGLIYVAQSVLLGRQKFRPPALILTSINIFKMIAGGIVLCNDGGLQLVAWMWLCGSILGAVAMVTFVIWYLDQPLGSLWPDFNLLAQHGRDILFFLLITLIASLESQSDSIILSGFHNEAQVGWYSAATTVTFSLILFSQAYRFAVYPLMTRYAMNSFEKLSQLYTASLRYLGIFVMATVAGIILLAPQIVQMVFGDDFAPTSQILRILVLTLVFIFLNEPNSRMMLVHDHQNLLVLFLSVSAVVNIVMNLLLIPSLGARGAAIARVCSVGILFTLNYIYVSRRLISVRLGWILTKPIVAALAMVLMLLPIRAWPLPCVIGIGGLGYMIVLKLLKAIPSDNLALIRQVLFRA